MFYLHNDMQESWRLYQSMHIMQRFENFPNSSTDGTVIKLIDWKIIHQPILHFLHLKPEKMKNRKQEEKKISKVLSKLSKRNSQKRQSTQNVK